MNHKVKDRRTTQLGMPLGTASNKLRKNVLFSFIQKLELDNCHRCGEKITDHSTLSIEHKIPWLDTENPVETFFDLENIAFSHLVCNSKAARHPNKKFFTEKEQKEGQRIANTIWKRKTYSSEKRHERYVKEGR